MSLQDIMAEQQHIVGEQKAIRSEIQNLARRIDSQYKGEIAHLQSRLDAQEGRIAQLSGNGASNGGRNGGAAPPVHQAPRGGGGYPAQRPGSSMDPPARGGYAAAPPASRGLAAAPRAAAPVRKSEEDLHAARHAVAAAVKAAAKSDTWQEPAEHKVAPSTTDRFELQLKGAIERSKEMQRYANNPIQGMQGLFNRMDKNHSGKVDVHELVQLSKILEFQADEKSLSALFNRYDLDHNKVLTIEEFCRSLFKLDGDTEFKAKSAIAKMREVLSLRAGGFESLQAMNHQFAIMDRNHSGSLTKEEFGIALEILFSAYNVKFSAAEKNALFQMFDFDKSGTVDYNEFTRGIRGDMSDSRLNWVKQAFACLDKDGSGVVDTAEMSKTYDVSKNPAVQSGKITPEDAIRQFMKHFDANSDGRITFAEFTENYQWVSASIDNDDYFELMMRNAWHITGGSGWCANTSNLRVLVRHNNGPDEVVCVEHDMGLPREPDQKYQEIVRRLQQQGVKDIKKVELTFAG